MMNGAYSPNGPTPADAVKCLMSLARFAFATALGVGHYRAMALDSGT
jgi:hypothetical protein